MMENEVLMEREIYMPRLKDVPSMPELRTLYSRLGEENLRQLVDKFYDRVADSEISFMFPKQFDTAKKDQADFLIQALGGPDLYTERKGPARMRTRHFPFVITEKFRLVWLGCYRQAMEELGIPDFEKSILDLYLDHFSKWMVNAQDETNS
jgi:hemoglobin